MDVKRISPIKIIIVLFLFSFTGCAGVEKRSDIKPIKIEAGKEILIARDVGRGGSSFTRWCGGEAILIDVETHGVEYINLRTKKRIRISKENDSGTPLNCTPDGKWALYESSENLRQDPAYVYSEGFFQGWMGSVGDLYRYEIETGRREKISSIRYEGDYDAFSPDGKKILLGGINSFASTMSVPDWEGLWLTEDWIVADGKWFSDSSGVALWEHNPNKICIEIFGDEGWAKCFIVALDEGNISPLAVDSENRIYFQGNDPYRCHIEDRELVCAKIDKSENIIDFIYLADGSRVYKRHIDFCLHHTPLGERESQCVIYVDYGDEYYESIHLTGLSLDGRWLVYKRAKRINQSDGEFSHYQYDLFAVEIIND